MEIQKKIDVGGEGYYINQKDESLYVQVSRLDYGLYIQKKIFFEKLLMCKAL